jgi:serine/threonine-protein kinase
MAIRYAHQQWKLGAKISKGGFGSVFEAVGHDGTKAAVKVIPKEPGAGRELLFEELSGLDNVIPILDSGESDSDYHIVMPRAEESLGDFIDRCGPVPADVATAILVDIAQALVGIEGRVVHRDLKPANILRYRDRWCLADFGISRYAEASTSPETRKFALSPPYAAPERWRAEHAEHAVDIYSLGIIGFELLQGKRPFHGPDFPDFRDQHLHQAPPPLPGIAAPLAALVLECLSKPPGSRPSANNVLNRLNALDKTPSAGMGALQEANLKALEVSHQAQAEAATAQSKANQRSELMKAAFESFERIKETIADAVKSSAPQAGGRFPFRLGSASLHLEPVVPTPASWFGTPGYESLDVIAHSAIRVRTGLPEGRYQGRAHSLWYCDAQRAGAFRWFETAFMRHPLMGQSYELEPTSFEPREDAFRAICSGMVRDQLAWPFTAIDQGDQDEFLERWLIWFAQAASGRLDHPRSMPERRPEGSYRVPIRRAQ